jgi:hypothetical protein
VPFHPRGEPIPIQLVVVVYAQFLFAHHESFCKKASVSVNTMFILGQFALHEMLRGRGTVLIGGCANHVTVSFRDPF